MQNVNLDDIQTRARSLLDSGRAREASVLFEQILLSRPNHVNALYSLGVSYFRLYKFNEAEGLFTKVLTIESGNALAAYYLGLCKERLGRTPEALAMYQLALQIKPDFEEARKKLQANTAPVSRSVMTQPPVSTPGTIIEPPKSSKSKPVKIPKSGSVTVRGIARRVKASNPTAFQYSSSSFTPTFNIVSFRLEIEGAAEGQTSLLVQWDGYRMVGSLDEGDRVEVSGKIHKGVLKPTRIINLETNSTVEVKVWLQRTRGFVRTVFYIIFFLAIALIALIAISRL